MLGLEHPDFHALLARNLVMPPPFLHAALHVEMERNAEVFISALRRSLPGIPERLIRMRVMFAMGALMMFCVHTRSQPIVRNPKSEEAILKELVRFMAAGLQSAVAVPGAKRSMFPQSPQEHRR